MKWTKRCFAGCGCYLGAAVLLALVSGHEARGGETRLLRSNRNMITFEVTVPDPELVGAGDGRVRVKLSGYGAVSPPGAFEIPGKTFHVAIPPGVDVRVSAIVQGEDRLGALRLARVPAERFIRGENDIPSTEIFYPPDPWQSSDYPTLVVTAGPAFMGRQRVLPVRVNPLILDGEGARLVRKLTITVVLEGGGSPSPPRSSQTVPVSSRWRRLYDGLLVNPEDVSEYIRPLRIQRVSRSRLQEIKRLRLHIPETGCYAVRADSLIEAGLSAGLSPGQIALKKRYYDENEPDFVREVDVPMLVINGSSSTEQVFSDDDLLVFHLLGIKDDADAGDLDAAFTDDNVVWLEEGVAGEFMAEGPPLSAAPGTPERNMNRSISRNRKDTYYFKNAGTETDEFYYVTRPGGTSIAVPFDVHNPAGADVLSLVVRLRGFDSGNNGSTLNFYIRNSGGGSSWIGNGSISRKNAVTYTFNDIDSGLLTDGVNSLVINSSLERIFLVNDLTVDYPSQFRAHDNTIEFGFGPILGIWKFRISGFSVNHGYLIEISDPFNPIQYELTSGFFEQDGAEYILEFDLDAPIERRFIVLGDGAGEHLERKQMAVDDTPVNLREKTGPYHTLIISHRDFIDDLTEYEEWRRSQGYRILKADVENVYDEFNGGNPSCDAIKRFIRYGFDHWGVEFVLLVGDGSEDHKRLSLPSPPDFIPPYTFGVRVSGEFEDEVTSSDRYYSFLDAQEPDPYPDVFVGRFPVGAILELRAIVTKLYRFEDEVEATDSWRRNIVLFSDDAWSGRYSSYRYKSYEREFEFSTDDIADDIDNSLPGGFGVRNLRLSRWTDAPHENPNGDPGQVIYSRTVDSVHTYFTPYLLDRLNEGCLFFSFQGHANRAVLTTEAAFATFKQWDHLRYLYERKPHIFTGFGCHISDFAHHYEGRRPADGPNGDCFSEQVLFKPGVAAVSTYASNGFEFLHENAVFSETLHRYIFQSPPSDSVPPQNAYTGAHWVLGEAITMAEITHIGNEPLYGRSQVFRYILLGDPMLAIDPGPPLMKLEANWDGNWEAVSPDSFSARHGSNDCILRFKASDVVALGKIALAVNGDSSWTDSLVITRLTDQDKTFSRAYNADVDYTVSLTDEDLLFRVFTPAGRLAGLFEIPITTTIRLFYNDYLEITPAVESPPTGTFKVVADFPAYIDQAPVLFFDRLEQDDVMFGVPNPDDSLHWEAAFYRENMPGGSHFFTVKVGEFSQDFFFTVTGEDLVMDSFCFPNPFTRGTNITYTLNLPVNSGAVDIYNVSGILVRTIDLPSDQLDAANYESPNSVYWDGRDHAGDPVANGTYIYVIQVAKDGMEQMVKGKSVKLE